MGLAIEDILGHVKRPVRSVSICLDGDLRGEWDELTQRLEAAQAQAGVAKMGDSALTRDLAQQIRDVEQRMRDASVVFRFRGISRFEREAIFKRFPPKDKQVGWDPEAGAPAMVAACAIEPEMTEAQATQLLLELDELSGDRLFNGAWIATTGSSDVPFSERASALISGSGSK